jgi:hypothetical protein
MACRSVNFMAPSRRSAGADTQLADAACCGSAQCSCDPDRTIAIVSDCQLKTQDKQSDGS